MTIELITMGKVMGNLDTINSIACVLMRNAMLLEKHIEDNCDKEYLEILNEDIERITTALNNVGYYDAIKIK